MNTPIVQFGTSRFLQAHADLFIHESNPGGPPPVLVVGSSGSPASLSRLAAFGRSQGFPIIIRGLEQGRAIEHTVHVRSVARGIEASADWIELTRIFVEQARFVVSNTTERGFAVLPDFVLDLSKPIGATPPGYPAKLLALLSARFQTSGKPLTILPTELVSRNGDTLRSIVLDLAQRSRASDGLLSYISEHCLFANSLVDRIVSSAIEPVGAVAEPYALWAVEAVSGLVMPCNHPAIAIVDSLGEIERLKLHILNLGHSLLVELWRREKLDADMTVHDAVGIPEIRAELTQIYENEVLPGFAALGLGTEAVAYMASTLDRFGNPFLEHRLADIAQGHSEKVKRRIEGFINWISPAGISTPTISAIAYKHRDS